MQEFTIAAAVSAMLLVSCAGNPQPTAPTTEMPADPTRGALAFDDPKTISTGLEVPLGSREVSPGSAPNWTEVEKPTGGCWRAVRAGWPPSQGDAGWAPELSTAFLRSEGPWLSVTYELQYRP